MNPMLWIRKKVDAFTAKHGEIYDELLKEAKKLADEAHDLKTKAILRANGAFVPGVQGLSLQGKDEDKP